MSTEPETAQRIPCLEEDRWHDDVRELLIRGTPDGRPRQSAFLHTLAWHPGFYKRWVGVAAFLQTRGDLPARWREIVILRCAWLTRGANEWTGHVQIAHEAGITEAECNAVVEGPGSCEWSNIERFLLTAVDELRDSGTVSDETWAGLAAELTEPQLIEVVALIGQYHQICWLQNALRVPSASGRTDLSAR